MYININILFIITFIDKVDIFPHEVGAVDGSAKKGMYYCVYTN